MSLGKPRATASETVYARTRSALLSNQTRWAVAGLVAIGLPVLLQWLRIWVVATLGPYWTTRIITLEAAPLVRDGPFRWLRHPNYAVVAGEIAVLPLVFGAWQIALVWSLLNALLLWHRIRVENTALQPRQHLHSATEF